MTRAATGNSPAQGRRMLVSRPAQSSGVNKEKKQYMRASDSATQEVGEELSEAFAPGSTPTLIGTAELLGRHRPPRACQT